ncbi:hypothetical protein [Dyella acidisoli]|uniref:Uncharacterized protein n=1 Tax=Dyella acidisoli TaxID=1867834 RepID=A0ABQ5XU69_9GAMM|nr:hypothetical protein [Dyella acidisoli]GLQ95148.1 hypothetical protein GCM10007901_41030 [Dyella acidisoli]
MCQSVVLASAIFMLSLTYGEVAYAQNVASETASQSSQTAFATEPTTQSTNQQQYTVPQAAPWQPDFSQIKSPDEIRTAMAQRRQKFETTLNSWVGGDINELIMAWGAPTGVYKMPNQNTVFTWQTAGGMPTPEGGELMISCKISIFTDPRGRIFSWRWEGNGCV